MTLKRALSNRALPVHHTGTENGPWDGPAAVAAMPAKASVLYYCHAWQDSASVDADTDDEDNDADDKKSNYKFPHHKVKGGPANLNACRNGLARLENSKIPEGDKAGVRKHLQAHLDDAKEGDNAVTTRGHRSYRQLHNRVTPEMGTSKPRLQIINATEDVAEVMIYSEIGGWWGTNAEEFAKDMNTIKAKNINLRVNSGGGNVFDGLAIYNAIKTHPATVTAYVEGLAASAASFIVMAADTVVVARNAEMMIHNAQGLCMGDGNDMREMADFLDRNTHNIADIYTQRCGGDVEDWLDLMAAETWYIGQEAVDVGLADRVGDLSGSVDNKLPHNRAGDAELDELPEGFNFLEAVTRAFKEGSE